MRCLKVRKLAVEWDLLKQLERDPAIRTRVLQGLNDFFTWWGSEGGVCLNYCSPSEAQRERIRCTQVFLDL